MRGPRFTLIALLLAASIDVAHGSNKAAASIAVESSEEAPRTRSYVVADMHDGDEKMITVVEHAFPFGLDSSLTIRPHGNDQSWVVKSEIKNGQAVIDFNVPGKPNPPPVNLTATFYRTVEQQKVLEFTDPSGTLASAGYPLNAWLEVKPESGVQPMRKYYSDVYADMHDGDEKRVTIMDASLTIRPHGNNQSWVVQSVIKNGEAVIDFNVPGKPSPPPVNLTASFLLMHVNDFSKGLVRFTDPSGTIAAAGYPLNAWVQLPA